MQAFSRDDHHIVESIHLNMLKMGSLEDQINQRDLKTIIGSPRELRNYKHTLLKKQGANVNFYPQKQQERLMNVK